MGIVNIEWVIQKKLKWTQRVNSEKNFRLWSAATLSHPPTCTHSQLHSKYHSRFVFYVHFCFHGNHPTFNTHHTKRVKQLLSKRIQFSPQNNYFNWLNRFVSLLATFRKSNAFKKQFGVIWTLMADPLSRYWPDGYNFLALCFLHKKSVRLVGENDRRKDTLP